MNMLDPAKSADRVTDAMKLWLRFRAANRRAQDAMEEFASFSYGLDDKETKALAEALIQDLTTSRHAAGRRWAPRDRGYGEPV